MKYALLLVLLLGSGCGSPTAPIEDYAGFWSGTWTLTSCSEVGTSGFCAGFSGTHLATFTFTQASTVVEGTLGLGSTLPGLLTSPVRGIVGPAGQVNLSGAVTNAGSTTTISACSLTPSGSSASGGLVFTILTPNAGLVSIVGGLDVHR